MPLKTILVCLNSESHTANLTKAAAALARKHDAHVIGLHAIEALVVYPGVAMHIPGSVYEHFNDSQRAQSEAIKKIFVQHTENEDFVAEWALVAQQRDLGRNPDHRKRTRCRSGHHGARRTRLGRS